MTLYKGTQCISGIQHSVKYNANNLLDFKWSDHIIEDVSWLRADTFSWQSGQVYIDVYNKLMLSLQGATSKTDQGITFYECTNGFRIALADQEEAISTLYESVGVAWYYILDIPNQRFKLPRTKYGFVGLRDNAGKYANEMYSYSYIPLMNYASRSNFSSGGTAPADGWVMWNNAGTTNATVNGVTVYIGGNDASNEGPAVLAVHKGDVVTFTPDTGTPSFVPYRENTKIPSSTQMYLYFYIGEFSQTAIEQTAGLNTELLNQKVDSDTLYDCQVVVETYTNGTEGYRVWSDGYCEQWGYIPASNSTSQVNRLLKTMKDTNYHINITAVLNNWSGGLNSVFDLTVNSFKMWTSDDSSFNSCPIKWQVCGYLAEGEY